MKEKTSLFLQICALSCATTFCVYNGFLTNEEYKTAKSDIRPKKEVALQEEKKKDIPNLASMTFDPIRESVLNKQTNIPKIVVEEAKHPYDDKAFSQRKSLCSADISSRDIRYGISSQQVTFSVIKAGNGQSIPRKELESIVRSVFKKLPHIKTTDENVSLVVETIITESNGGEYIVSPDKKDLGIAQIRISSAKDMFSWLSFKHPDVKEAIMAFYKKEEYNNSLYDNLKFNIPFSVAVCITEYWRKLGGNYNKQITTLEERAIVWKTIYNSSKGKGTVNNYIQRVKNYNV